MAFATACLQEEPVRLHVRRADRASRLFFFTSYEGLRYLAGIFRVADFPTPAAGQNGNLARNAYRGLRFIDVSLSLSKKFSLTDRFTGEFRLDAFNALNRVNLGDPVMDLSNTSFGRSTSQLSPRSLQTGIRLRI